MKQLLIFLLCLTATHAQVADKYETAAKKKWEDTIKKFEQLDPTTDYPAESILFMGSSSIRLWSTLAQDMAPHPVIQRGYGGAKFQDLAVFAERIVHPHEFRAVAIFVANDIVGKNDSDLTPEEVAALYADVVKTVREKNAKAPVFLIAITPTQSRWKAWPEIKKANAAMQAVCEAQDNVHFIATEQQFLKEDGTPKTELFRDDQLHLNRDGYKLWTRIIRPAIEKQLAQKKADKRAGIRLERDGHWLVIRDARLPGGEIRINYLEAYCRPGSTDADWVEHTVIKHRSELISVSDDGKVIKLRDILADGVTVDHTITAGSDEVSFSLNAHNPRQTVSQAHWAQPCVRLGEFTGFGTKLVREQLDDYLPKCFVFIDGKLARMPTANWAKEARYTPGQVWAPKGVPRSDVNPRPLSSTVPSNGLIGCFSGDEKLVFATAWEPYQELFQGVARCLHSDLRIGGLQPGENKQIRGKIYLVGNDVPALLERYAKDFPEHRKGD